LKIDESGKGQRAGPFRKSGAFLRLAEVDEPGVLSIKGPNVLSGYVNPIHNAGHNIDPKLIEEPLHRHPAVALAAAIGRPDSRAGETPVLYVQLKAGATASETELLEYARAHILERAAHPKTVKILQTMPVTAVGKIFKPALSMM
jgi:fatty-acyl-CoA synthase